MSQARKMKVKLSLRDDIEITPEAKEWLRCVQDKISKEYSKIENEIKSRILLGLPIVFKDGKLLDVKDIINLPDIEALNRPIKPELIQTEIEAEKTLRFLKTGRQHD